MATHGIPEGFCFSSRNGSPKPEHPFTGVSGAIFKSTDSGTTWTASSTGMPDNMNWITSLAIDPQNPSTVYIGTSGISSDGSCDPPCKGYDDGVFRSTDAGTTWTAVNTGLSTAHVS